MVGICDLRKRKVNLWYVSRRDVGGEESPVFTLSVSLAGQLVGRDAAVHLISATRGSHIDMLVLNFTNL